MKKLRYGMVGGGIDGNIGSAHRAALRLTGSAELVAGCFSRDFEKNIKSGVQLGVSRARCYESYASMAKAEQDRPDRIDFVVVVTPNRSHYEVCHAFLEAGIPIACDKPLTTTLEQAEALEDLSDKKNIPFMVTYTYTGHHMFQKARDLVREGHIGTLRKVVAEYPQSWLADENSDGGKQGAWRMDAAQSGGTNCLGDIGSHVQNAVAALTGMEFQRVLADMNAVVPGRTLDDDDTILFRLQDGTVGSFWVSQLAYGHENDLQIRLFGSKGALCWSLKEPKVLRLYDTQDQVHILTPQQCDAARFGRFEAEAEYTDWNIAMCNLYEHFMERICSPGAPVQYPTVKAGVQSLRFLQACLKSSNQGGVWVDVRK